MGRSEPVRVAIVEAQTIFAYALCDMLSTDPALEVVGVAAAFSAEVLRALQPDVLVVDIDGAEIDLMATLRVCDEMRPEVRVIVLSLDQQIATVSKTGTLEELIDAVKGAAAVAAG